MNDQEILLYNSLQGLYLLQKGTKKQVLHDLLGIQSQFSGYARLSLFLRCSDFTEENYGHDAAKIWSHRGTMYLVDESDLKLHLAASGARTDFREGAWKLSVQESVQWSDFILQQVKAGITLRNDLKKACREAGMPDELEKKVFYGWGGLIREMVLRGMIVGTTGNQKEYRIPNLQGKEWSIREARLEMLRIYFEHFGPATISDCKYFFGDWPKEEISALLKEYLPTIRSTKIGRTTYYHVHPLITEGEIPPCVIVPGFDQLILGYKERSRMIDREHLRKLTNMAGIVFPCLILRGRIRARWKLENDTFQVVPFEKLLKKDETAIRRAVKTAFGKKIKVEMENLQ